MKVRVKYSKTGPLKFISHLDVMRFFQKSIRRAGLDIAYTTGLSPHQVISFAAPMPLMLTSVAEYFDAEFVTLPSHDEFIDRLNAAGTEHMKVLDAAVLPEKALNSMAAVTASSYRVELTEKGNSMLGEIWKEKFPDVIRSMVNESEIVVVKKTKTKEEPTDIRPMIHRLEFRPDSEPAEGTEVSKAGSVFLLLSAGSKVNLRPEQILSEICKRLGLVYDRFHFDILRLETYMDAEQNAEEDGTVKKTFAPLIDAGNRSF